MASAYDPTKTRAIACKRTTFEYYETLEEAERAARMLAGAASNTEDVIVFRAVKVVRPVPKEVEVVELK